MTKKMRGIAFLTAVLVLVVMLSSFVYIAHEADHDCTREHCPICYQLSVHQNVLKNLSVGVIAAAFAVALTDLLALVIAPRQDTHTLATLITMKVKISN